MSVLTDLKTNTSMFEYCSNFSIIAYNVSLETMASKVNSFLKEVSIAGATYISPNEVSEASEREQRVVMFRKRKVEHISNLALEH